MKMTGEHRFLELRENIFKMVFLGKSRFKKKKKKKKRKKKRSKIA